VKTFSIIVAGVLLLSSCEQKENIPTINSYEDLLHYKTEADHAGQKLVIVLSPNYVISLEAKLHNLESRVEALEEKEK
jgi:hypothetical protein